MGWAIIALTVVIKLVLFPLAYKSYASMAKMRELQPQMEKLKEAAGDDRQKMQQEMMALYKREKVNPASGCLPILLQIPIFFSLYKVIFVTLELRHAPWSAGFATFPRPTVIALQPLRPSSLGCARTGIDHGPRLPRDHANPPRRLDVASAEAEPGAHRSGAKADFRLDAWVFMFMLGSFASGLVLYWIANNTITFTQQYLIMRSHGYKPNLLGNILGGLKRKPGSGSGGK